MPAAIIDASSGGSPAIAAAISCGTWRSGRACGRALRGRCRRRRRSPAHLPRRGVAGLAVKLLLAARSRRARWRCRPLDDLLALHDRPRSRWSCSWRSARSCDPLRLDLRPLCQPLRDALLDRTLALGRLPRNRARAPRPTIRRASLARDWSLLSRRAASRPVATRKLALGHDPCGPLELRDDLGALRADVVRRPDPQTTSARRHRDRQPSRCDRGHAARAASRARAHVPAALSASARRRLAARCARLSIVVEHRPQVSGSSALHAFWAPSAADDVIIGATTRDITCAACVAADDTSGEYASWIRHRRYASPAGIAKSLRAGGVIDGAMYS